VEGKTPEEVEEYYRVFWKRCKELADWKKYDEQITRGEDKLRRLAEIQNVLEDTVHGTHQSESECACIVTDTL